MIGTLDLQVNTIDFSEDLTHSSPAAADGRGLSSTDFADVLRDRVDTRLSDTSLDGDFLPPDGNSSPLALEPIPVSLPEGTVALELTTAALDFSGQAAPPASVLENSPDGDSSGDLGARRDASLEGTPPPGVVAAVPIDVFDPARVFADDKGLPRDFVPPSVDTQVDKRTHRIFVPPSVAQRGDTPVGLAEQLESNRNNPVSRPAIELPVVHRRLIEASESRRSEPLTANFDAVKHPPVTSISQVDTRSESGSIRETARMLVSRFQQDLGRGQGLAATQSTPAAPSISSNGSSAFVSNLELAAELISTPVRDTRWADRMGERLLMLTGGQQRSAEIRLTPAELGPLRVQISINEGTTNVAFQAHHALTRDALEQAMPRLRELLQENGLTLGDTSVSERDVSERQNEQSGEAENPHAQGDGEPSAQMHLDPGEPLSQSRRVANGLVDTFA